MSVAAKGRRQIIVGNQKYFWYVALDDDSPWPTREIATVSLRTTT